MRERFRRHGSIVGDLAVMVLVTLLPLVILGGYLSYRAVRDEHAEIAATAQRQARETAQRADAIVAETRTRLLILSETATLREADPDGARALLADVKARIPYYDDLFAVDTAGTVYASVARRTGGQVSVADQAYFQTLLREDRPVISEVLLSRTTGRPAVVIAVPIHTPNGGGTTTTAGAVAATLDLILLQQWLDNRTLPPQTTITVVDEQGRVLARSLDPDRWVGQTIADLPIVRTAVDRHEGIVDGVNVDGIARLNGFATAEEVPWYVLVGIPRDAVYAPLEREIRLMVARLGLVALATATLALVVGRRIVRPVQALTGGAQAIAGGDLGHRIALERRDELGQLAAAMNQMADQLVGHIDALRQAQERLEAAVAQVGRALTSAVEPVALLTPLVEAAAALTRADAGLLAFDDGAPPIAGDGLTPPEPAALAALLESCDRSGAPAATPGSEALTALGMRHCLTMPVRARGEALATLLVFRRRPEPFGEADARLLRTFADQAAVAIEQARLRTEVAQAEALRELHRLQTDFLATASHELRAPLAGITGYAEVLLREDLALDDTTRRECLDGIKRLTARLAAQVRAFFDAMRAGEGRLGLRREPVELGALATVVVHGFAARAPGHDFRLAVAPDLPPALADPERVEDVLTNLLDNAVKYAPDGGPVEVTIERAGDDVLVAVRDEGPGIPVAEQGRVFERFYRVDQSTARRAGGAGLGLYLCRAYVSGMGGRIWLESAPGAGSTFRFTLPAAPAASPAAVSREAPDLLEVATP